MKHTPGLALVLALLSSAPFAAAQSAEWGQCGGQGWTGPTTCVSGTTCVFVNAWYSQCLRQTTTAAPTSTKPTSTYTPPPSTTPTPTPTTTKPSTTTTTPPATTSIPSTGNPNGLDGRMKAKGKQYFGTCSDSGLISNSQNAAILKSDFGALTPENSMKWDTIEPSQNQFNYGGGDTLVNFAKSNGKLVRGHNLLWHSQLPSWVSNINSAATLTSVIQNHISHEAGRWAGSIFHWDVCNEIMDENGSLRQSVFSKVLGESFVAIAYKAARAADSKAVLYINDYNLDSNNAKAQGIVALVKRVNSANGQIIDGIGTQMHLSAGQTSGLTAVLTLLASTGLEVAITELDIAGAAANDYSAVTKACLGQPKCVGITVWGVRDPDSWRASTTPLLYDSNYKPKAAYNAVISALA